MPWVKNPDILVLWADSAGYQIINRATRQKLLLNAQQAQNWADWRLYALGGFVEELERTGLIYHRQIDTDNRRADGLKAFDALCLVPQRNWSKGYSETPDLTILFNTQSMASNNPLLALGPYGSLIWRGIQSQASIGILRQEAYRIFGCDEVISFIQRLMRLGFLVPIPAILELNLPSGQAVKEFPAPEIQFSLQHARVPWYCLWEVCTMCDLRCRICYLPDFKQPGPPLEVSRRIVTQIVDAGVFYVGLLGGEVMLYKNIEEIVSLLRSEGIFTKIITNGQRLTAKMARLLADAGLNQIEVSFDGLSRVTHEASRGSGTFAQAISALDEARQQGIPRAGMVLTLFQENIGELQSLPGFMSQYDLNECYLSLFKKTGQNGSSSPFTPLDGVTVRHVRAQLQDWRTRFPDLSITLLSECSCGRTSVVIGADQQLRLCTFDYSHPIGDLHRDSLQQIWRRLEPFANIDGPLGYCA
jgi:MoaA/NifB/PqqE/SkfB family radical SAM enzyme